MLVGDPSLFRGGIRGLLEQGEEFKVVAEASSGEEFLSLLPTTEVDVVFMDIAMEGISGDEATKRALEVDPDMKIITLSMFGDEHYYTRMVESGAKGFLLKNSDINEVVEAVRTVAQGGDYFSGELLESITGSMRSTEQLPDNEESLSAREAEILIAVCQGLSNQEIADKLFISKRTVDKHRANIMDKTGCKNTANLVIYAIKNHLVEF